MVSRPAETRISSRLNVNRVRENKIVMTSQNPKTKEKGFTLVTVKWLCNLRQMDEMEEVSGSGPRLPRLKGYISCH